MSNAIVFDGVMRELNMDALAAKRKLDARKKLLYERLPRVEQIDRELSQIGLDMVQKILKRQDSVQLVSSQKEKYNALNAEREQLLYENGYDDSFFTDVYKCVACEDTGFVGGGHCTCLKQRLISCYFDMSNLGKVFKEENFDAFNMSYYSEQIEPNIGISPKDNIKRIWKAALEFVENFGENGDNWLLYGLSGRGKTFLSNCIAGDLLQKGHTVLYTTAPELFRRVEEERFGKGDAKRKGVTGINFAYEADLLIIDDLGTEFATVVTDSELFNFINARMLAQKSTIINTNLTPTDIDANYSNRISSRIHGNYILFHVFGDDIRKAKKYGVSV